jgi:glycerophosphoryl diester phosphodiesterase
VVALSVGFFSIWFSRFEHMTDIDAGRLRRRGGGCSIVAHRGYSSAFPENTLVAYERAIGVGADVVEIDLRTSRDGAVVCHHDATTGGENIAGLDLPELKARGIAALDEVLPALFGRVSLLFDLKLPDVDLAADALARLRDHSMVSQAVIGVRSLGQARLARRTAPDSVLLGFLNSRDFDEFYALGGDIARLWEDDCDEAAVEAARGGGHPVWVTAGRRSLKDRPGDIDSPRLSALLRQEIDGILVNDPVQAIRMRDTASGRQGSE